MIEKTSPCKSISTLNADSLSKTTLNSHIQIVKHAVTVITCRMNVVIFFLMIRMFNFCKNSKKIRLFDAFGFFIS